MKRTVAYYISSHGFGHMTRSFEIIRNFSGFETHIVSGHSPETAEFLGFGGLKAASYRACKIDTGVAQKNALEIDIGKTLYENTDFIEKYSELAERETEFLSEKKVSVVFSDVSPLPVTAAKRLNIPVWVVGNFTWDWIMEGFEKYDTHFEKLKLFYKNQYILADGAYLLPLSGGFEMFGKIYKTGLVCRKPSFSSQLEARTVLGLEEGQKAVVFTFGGFDTVTSLDFNREDVSVFVPGFEDRIISKNIKIVSTAKFSFPDVLLSADCVVTKPGYGIVSELYYLKTAGFLKKILYCDRGPFREYGILKKFIDSNFPESLYIDSEKIRSGEWIKAV